MATIDDFRKLDIRIGRIIEAKEHPNADKLYILQVSIGDDQQRQLVAGIRQSYSKEELLGKYVVVLANLDTAEIRGERSEGMVLAAKDEQGVVIIVPDRRLAQGSKVS